MDLKNREISLGIGGIAVGIMLGVSALLYNQNVEGAVIYRSPLIENGIRQSGLSNRTKARITPSAPTPTTQPKSLRRADTAECRVAQEVATALRLSITDVLPTDILGNVDNVKNMNVVAKLDQATVVLIDKHCPAVAESRPAAQITIDNDCTRFTGARYTTCLNNEAGGVTYP